MSIDQLISLGFKAMKQVPDMKIKSDIFDVGVISVATKKFELLPLEKVNSYVTKV
jgi:metal-sulfur cluster biosynthetic enzyme